MNKSPIGVLYSFRRCPYAMRARLALLQSGLQVVLREVDLKNKPQALLQASPKGTVPVLVLASGEVIDESLAIVDYVAALSTGEHLRVPDATSSIASMSLERLAAFFIPACRQYKYAEADQAQSAREQCFLYLSELETQLSSHSGYLLGERQTVLDINVFPFIRQCRLVDTEWFDALPLPALLNWLQRYLASDVVQRMMLKVVPWEPNQAEVVLS